ncbi:MAG: ankyrin repeat domain-containing protein [Acidobacteriota bacterium]
MSGPEQCEKRRWYHAACGAHVVRVFACWLAVIVSFHGCSRFEIPRDPEAAQVELKKLGLNYDTRTFLESARSGNTRVVELFLIAGMDPDAKSDSGVTALMESAYAGKAAAVHVLLARGAKVGLRGSDGRTALHRAAAGPFGYASVQALLDGGADPNARAANGETPLMEALLLPLSDSSTEFLAPNYVRTVTALLERGADVNAPSLNGITPLMRAAIGGNSQMVHLLLDGGANAGAVSNEGKSAEEYALQRNNHEIAKIIKAADG